MKIEEFIQTICDKIKYKPVRAEIKNELYEHIIEEKESYIKEGLTESEAEEKAIQNIGTPEEVSRGFNKIYKRKLDIKLLIIFVALIALNILLIVTNGKSRDVSYICTNTAYIAIGIIISIGIYFVNYKKLQKFALGIGILGIAISIINVILYNNQYSKLLENLHLNVLTLFINIIAFVLLLNNMQNYSRKKLAIFITYVAITLTLIFISNDVTSFIIMFVIYVALSTKEIFRSGIKKYKIINIISILALVLIALFNIFIAKPHLLNRIFEAGRGDYSVIEMRNRLTNSKMIGQSQIPKGENTEYLYENFSNYSFVYLIQQYGKIIGIGILILFGLLAVELIYICKKIKDDFGKNLIICISIFLFIQVLINLLSILGIAYIGNSNIPFITQNDASVVVYMMCIAIVLTIYGRKNLDGDMAMAIIK